MEHSAYSRPRSSISNRQHFYCYICARKYTHMTEFSANFSGVDDRSLCKYCGSDFVEAISNPMNFKPSDITNYVAPNDAPSEREGHSSENPGYRIVRRTIRLPNSSPFVKDVLLQLFPQVFRRASLDRIETIRNILNTLNLFDLNSDSSNGPTDKIFVEKLEKKLYNSVENKENFSNCPICTDNFSGNDKVIALDCHHLFHDNCILPWLELNNSCPNCRLALPKQP